MKQCSCPKLYVCHVPNPQKSEGHKQVCLAQAVTSSRNNFVVGQRCIMAEASRVLRPGPQSLDELCSWPLTVVQSLVSAKDGNDGERFSRLKALLGRGLWIDSDYSGIAGEHEVMHQMVEALNLVASGSGVEALKDVKIVHGRFCDKAKQQQQVLRFISSLHNNSICVFDDLNDRLPETARAVLDNMTPKQKISSKEAADLYRNMSEWLMENRAWVFAQENSCQCLVHDRRCRVVKDAETSETDQTMLSPSPLSSQSEEEEEKLSAASWSRDSCNRRRGTWYPEGLELSKLLCIRVSLTVAIVVSST